MNIIREFYQASDPGRTLFVNNSPDAKYYIDFSSVRGSDIFGKLKQKITFFKPNEPTCTLIRGHVGMGKSTELLRLQIELEKSGFHVVYFESGDDLEMTDVDIPDVLLAIARRVSESLDKITQESPNKFDELLQGAWKVLNSEVTGGKLKVPVLGDVGLSADKEKLSLSVGIGEITSRMKNDPTLREKLNQYLVPQKTKLLKAINQELLEPAIAKLKQMGKNGLVVIIDNLDRVDNRIKPWGRTQQEHLFLDHGEIFTKLNCHLVCTIPTSLKFSNDYGMLIQLFLENPRELAMIPVQWADGRVHTQGISLMQQMVLARAFPNMTPEERLNKITEIFDSAASLEWLCIMSGGHVRGLLRLLNNWIMENLNLPLTRQTLDDVISSFRNDMISQISDEEWQMLRHVNETKKITGDQRYEKLIRNRVVNEYQDSGELWFDVNPILANTRQLKIQS